MSVRAAVEESWSVCCLCPEDDNEWPESAFSRAGSGRLRSGGRICNDCHVRRYGTVGRRVCGNCGRIGRTRSTKPDWRCHECFYRARSAAYGDPAAPSPGTEP